MSPQNNAHDKLVGLWHLLHFSCIEKWKLNAHWECCHFLLKASLRSPWCTLAVFSRNWYDVTLLLSVLPKRKIDIYIYIDLWEKHHPIQICNTCDNLIVKYHILWIYHNVDVVFLISVSKANLISYGAPPSLQSCFCSHFPCAFLCNGSAWTDKWCCLGSSLKKLNDLDEHIWQL